MHGLAEGGPLTCDGVGGRWNCSEKGTGVHSTRRETSRPSRDLATSRARPVAVRPEARAGDGALAAERPLRLWGWHTFLSIAVTVVLLTVMVTMVDLGQVWTELGKCDLSLAFLGMLAHYATYPVRGMRWRRCLAHLEPGAGSGRFGLFVFFYNAVDNIVPAKLGDLYASHLVRINLGIRRSAALGSIVFIRMVDAWVVLGLAALSSWMLFSENLPNSVVWTLIFGGILAIAVSVAILTFFLLKKSLPHWVPEPVRRKIVAFQAGMWPQRSELPAIGLLTLVIWGLESVWMLLLAMSFGIHPGLAEIMFLTMIPLLASTFPLTPSGAGVVELTLFGCLRAVSIATPVAVSLTVLNRFIDYWLHIALGLLTWTVRHRLGLRTWREVPFDDEPLAPVSDQESAPAVGVR